MNEVTLYKPNELIGAIDQIEVSRNFKNSLAVAIFAFVDNF